MARTVQRIVALAACLAWTACGGGSPGDGGRAASGTGESGEPAVTATAAPTPTVSTETYRSQHDPNAVYARDTFNPTGSYLKVDMDDLTPDQFNRVVHRLKTELSTCGSGYTIDECLVNRPQCWVAVELLKQVVREETLGG